MVDRGFNSVETILYLLLLKLIYPSQVTLIRGNHESRKISVHYGFYDECLKKYGHAGPWNMLCELFDYLPLAGLIEGKILVLHGGLSPDIKMVD